MPALNAKLPYEMEIIRPTFEKSKIYVAYGYKNISKKKQEKGFGKDLKLSCKVHISNHR